MEQQFNTTTVHRSPPSFDADDCSAQVQEASYVRTMSAKRKQQIDIRTNINSHK